MLDNLLDYTVNSITEPFLPKLNTKVALQLFSLLQRNQQWAGLLWKNVFHRAHCQVLISAIRQALKSQNGFGDSGNGNYGDDKLMQAQRSPEVDGTRVSLAQNTGLKAGGESANPGSRST